LANLLFPMARKGAQHLILSFAVQVLAFLLAASQFGLISLQRIVTQLILELESADHSLVIGGVAGFLLHKFQLSVNRLLKLTYDIAT
jgi:hypothetical protein